MPIRVMMWNIENFTINKYNNNKWDNAHRRWNNILDTIQRVNPDIFVLIEVESGGAQEGTICGGTSAQGVLRLLADLQAHPNNNFNTFRVVPPIVSGVGGPAANFHVVNRAYQMPAHGYPPNLGMMPDPMNPANNVNATIPLIRTRYNIGAANPQVSSANAYFRNYERFGKIGASRGASDHMALVIDV